MKAKKVKAAYGWEVVLGNDNQGLVCFTTYKKKDAKEIVELLKSKKIMASSRFCGSGVVIQSVKYFSHWLNGLFHIGFFAMMFPLQYL